MAAPQITELPAAPSRSDDPDNFVAKADAFLGALNGMGIEINQLAGYLNLRGAGLQSFKGAYAVGTSYALADTVSYLSRFWISKTAANAGNTPVDGSAFWEVLDAYTGIDFLPCVLATTTNDSLSGLSARDGVTPTAGQRVLVTAQTDTTKNGPYVAASGAWARAFDASTTGDFIQGRMVYITGGTLNGGKTYRVASAVASLGTSAVTFSDAIVSGNQTIRGLFNTTKANDIASGGTVNLDTATGNYINVTGTTTITNVTLASGATRWVRFTSALSLGAGGNLSLPGGAAFSIAAGDIVAFVGDAGTTRLAGWLPFAAANQAVQRGGDSMTGNLTNTANNTAARQIATGGSVGAPAITVNGSAGFFSPAADSIGTSTKGVERNRVDGSGNFTRVIPGGSTLYPDFCTRAWAHFNGTNGAIQASGNVSSITRNALGDYTANFSAMVDANYSFAAIAQSNINSGTVNGFAVAALKAGGLSSAPSLKSTTQVQFVTWDAKANGTTLVDNANISFLMVR